MINLNDQQLDAQTMSRLKIRAERHGVSIEEEVRRIVQEAVAEPEPLGDMALRMFGRAHGLELNLPERRPHEPLDLEQ